MNRHKCAETLRALSAHISEFLDSGHWPSIGLYLDRLETVIDQMLVGPATEREIKKAVVAIAHRHKIRGFDEGSIDQALIDVVRWAEERCGVRSEDE